MNEGERQVVWATNNGKSTSQHKGGVEHTMQMTRQDTSLVHGKLQKAFTVG